MSNRMYHFRLPYTIPGFKDTIAVEQLQKDGIWPKVPKDIQLKMIAGEGWFGSGFVATKDELDELPDDVWSYVAAKLNLAWSNNGV